MITTTLNGIGREMSRPDGRQCYVAADGRRFLMRFCNGSFGSKWAGFWNVPIKILDYFSYKLVVEGREETLSVDNCDSFTLEGSNRALHRYFPSLPMGAEETSSVINEGLVSSLALENREKKPLKVAVELECGFNFRRAGEDYHVREYETSVDDLGISVINDVGHCHVSATEKLRLLGQHYKDHFPGAYAEGLGWKFMNESNQRCMAAVLGMDVELKPLEKKTVRTLFGVHHKKPEDAIVLQMGETLNKVPGGLYISDKKYQRFIENLTCQMGTFEATTDNGFGFFSGHPNRTSFSCGDECLSARGYLNAGMPDAVKSALLTIQKHQDSRSGLMPSSVSTEGAIDYGVVDATPLWIIAACEYFDFANDPQFFGLLENPMRRALNAFDRLDVDGDFLVEVAPNERTWMGTTTLERTGKPIEVEALWLAAFGRAAALFEAYGNPEGAALKSKHDRIRNGLLGAFVNGDYFWDRITPSGEKTGRSINPLLLTYFGELDALQGQLALLEIEKEFTSPDNNNNGIVPFPQQSDGSFPDGMARNFLTAMMAVSEMNYGRTGEAVRYLDILLGKFGKRCINSIDEFCDRDGSPQGAVNDLLSVCQIPTIFDRHFFGLRPEASRNRLVIEPMIPAGMAFFERKNFRFNGRVLNFGFARDGSEVELFVKGLDPGTEVIFVPPKGTDEIDVNDRKVPIIERAHLKSFTALKISYKAV